MAQCTIKKLAQGDLTVTPLLAFELLNKGLIQSTKEIGVYEFALEDEGVLWQTLRDGSWD